MTFEPIVIELVKPLKFGKDLVTKLEFTREPVTKDLYGVSLTALDMPENIVTVTSRLTATPPPLLGEMCIDDLTTVTATVESFFLPGPTTGPTGSESSPPSSDGAEAN
ncbi:phage tail assembly protein [Desulfovibrio sp. OttesenSCG-928-C06]|nr:phage tail assembly protein [Desulfovibrio sp. OttesenSCG-928-C06]